jgi:hypothetical protein
MADRKALVCDERALAGFKQGAKSAESPRLSHVGEQGRCLSVAAIS